jgi:hypothetical protein
MTWVAPGVGSGRMQHRTFAFVAPASQQIPTCAAHLPLLYYVQGPLEACLKVEMGEPILLLCRQLHADVHTLLDSGRHHARLHELIAILRRQIYYLAADPTADLRTPA